jgi:penicillin amidase
MVSSDRMPRLRDPGRGFIVTANNRVVADNPGNPGSGGYFCTDAHPPYRARRIEQLIEQLSPLSPSDMATIHTDDLSEPAGLFQSSLAGLAQLSSGASAVRDLITGWDARMSPDSRGAACYARLRWALARIVAERSGLSGAPGNPAAQLPGMPSAASQLWWTLPALLRSGDTGLTGGLTWPELLSEALEAIAADGTEARWQDIHPALLTHPLASGLHRAAAQSLSLSRTGAGVGGDNETVWANGCRAESGTAAVYGAVARYVFDVGDWDNSSWVVFAGASGDPASTHYADQHEAWSAGELVPMRYSWDAIATSGTLFILDPDDASPDDTSLGVQP